MSEVAEPDELQKKSGITRMAQLIRRQLDQGTTTHVKY